MKIFLNAAFAFAVMLLASCSRQAESPIASQVANDEVFVSNSSEKSPAIASVVTGEFTDNIQIPANNCGVPTDCVWANFTQMDTSLTSGRNTVVSTRTHQTTGYSFNCSTGNASGHYGYNNSPTSTGRNYQITCKAVYTTTFKKSGQKGGSEFPHFTTTIVYTYTVKLLANGPTVSWTETWSSSGSKTVSKVSCQ